MSKSEFNNRATIEKMIKANKKLSTEQLDNFGDDKDVVLYAISHSSYDILSATEALTNDKDFMMKALDIVPVKHKSMVFSCAGEDAAKDTELFLKALKSSDATNGYLIVKGADENAIFKDPQKFKEALSVIQTSNWKEDHKTQITDAMFLNLHDPDLIKEMSAFRSDALSRPPSKAPKPR